ncbi:MAG TPA: glycosyltransferase family 9 protein [Thermodesulfovibrionales bacterium]|nr:glycosyltransferase family 9 protein [Thermodesulfovibrionales bacterium]
MIQLLIRNRIRKHRDRESEIREEDIACASTILFSVFARYGDSVIAFRVIKEFCEQNPGKRYLLLTTHQSLPYARSILGDMAECYSVNKRRNPLRLLYLASALTTMDIDVAFNPWSHGEDSEFFLTFARKFRSYRSFAKYTQEYNLYYRARNYMRLPEKRINLSPSVYGNAQKILLVPFSTDMRKTLDRTDLARLIEQTVAHFHDSEITIGLFRDELRSAEGLPGKRFFFGKSLCKSEEFLRLLKASDLLISVDSGPLHLADALGVRAIGIFGPTAPETIMHKDSTIVPLRIKQLEGVFCYVKSCTNPQCVHDLFKDNFLAHPAFVNFDTLPVLEERTCRIRSTTSSELIC